MWFGTTVAQSCKPILMRFVAFRSEFSGLPDYQLTFLEFCAGTSKKSLKMALSDTLLAIDVSFLSPWAKKKESEPIIR